MEELAGKVREAAKLHDPVAKTTVEIVKLCLDELKESLVTAEGDDMLRTQGAARQLEKLYRELTVTPPSIAPKE